MTAGGERNLGRVHCGGEQLRRVAPKKRLGSYAQRVENERHLNRMRCAEAPAQLG
jgi:hypothetical protein